MNRTMLTLLPVVLLTGLLSGCSLVSAQAQPSTTQVLRTIDPSGLQTVESTLQNMDAINSYQMKSSMQVSTGRFTRSVSFYGSVQLPGTILMDETIGGEDYEVYQQNQFAYYRSGNKWQAMSPLTELKPWESLLSLLESAPPSVVYSLPRQTVVSWNCNVYQFTVRAKPGNAVLHSLLPQGSSKTLPRNALYTVFLDASDGQLRQIEVESTVGVPNLGTSSFTGTTLLFAYNKKLTIKVPEDLLAQVELP